MKTSGKVVLAVTILTAAFVARAEWISGYVRGNGTYLAPYYRTPADGIPYDNLNNRDYPSQQSGYSSPQANSFGWASAHPKPMPYYGGSRFDGGLLFSPGIDSPKPLYGLSWALGSRP